MAIILDGKTLADKITNNLKKEILTNNYTPSLAVVIVGNNPASQIYVRNKNKKARELGIKSQIIEFPETIKQTELENEIQKLAQNNEIHAILVQLPLPKEINAQKIIELIPPQKDVDGFHPYNIGRLFSGFEPYAKACTPLGVIKILEEYDIDVEGKNVVIVGRSNIVGKPMGTMFLNKNATVTICHSKTKNLKEITKTADILVSAIGKSHFVKQDFVKENVIVIDVGINRTAEGVLVGDIDFNEVEKIASYITPVPKGVGPMTIAMLMQNTLDLYKYQIAAK